MVTKERMDCKMTKTTKKEIKERIAKSEKKFIQRKIEAEAEKIRIKIAKKFLHDEYVRVSCWYFNNGGMVMIGIWKTESAYRCSAAFKSPKDKVSTSRGKVLLAERLQSGSGYFTTMFEGLSIDKVERLFRLIIMTDIVQKRHVPKWMHSKGFHRIQGPGIIMDAGLLV